MPRQKNITKYITGFGGGMIAFMVILVPLGHFYFSYQDTLARLETEVEINARLVTRIISANPEMWEFQHLRIEEYLMSRPGRGGGGNKARFK